MRRLQLSSKTPFIVKHADDQCGYFLVIHRTPDPQLLTCSDLRLETGRHAKES